MSEALEKETVAVRNFGRLKQSLGVSIRFANKDMANARVGSGESDLDVTSVTSRQTSNNS